MTIATLDTVAAVPPDSASPAQTCTDPTTSLAEARARLRRHDRTPIRVHAILHVARSFQPTVITDISRGGLGLNGANGVFTGSRVRIELLSGEAQDGIVRWWLNGSCGVQFIEPLAAEDAFLAAILKRTAGRHAGLEQANHALARSAP